MRSPKLSTSRSNRSRNPHATFLSVLQLEDRALPSGGFIDTGTNQPEGLVDLAPRFSVMNPTGYLTGPQTGDPLALARGALQTFASAAHLQPGDVAAPDATSSYSDGTGGMFHAYFRQTFNGLDVINTSAGVHLTADGKVLTLNGSWVPGLSAQDTGVGTFPGPSVTPVQAVADAASFFNLTLTNPPRLVSQQGDLRRTATVVEPDASDKAITPALAYVYTKSGVRLAWEMELRTPDHQDWYHVAVDAQNGSVIFWSDYVDHFSSPSETYNVNALPSRSPDEASRSFEVNPYDPNFSPLGWLDNNGKPGNDFTDTRGNNVIAAADLDDTNAATLYANSSTPGLVYDAPLDLTKDPAQYVAAATHQLFYTDNMLHDIHAAYGFTEAAGNFQQFNYTGAGLGSDPLLADAQDGGNLRDFAHVDNANMATPPDGESPRMQMYVFPFDPISGNNINPPRDGDLDNEVMIHEYGHGISNRLTDGPADASALVAQQSGGMGEGWSDWWSLMLTQKTTDTKFMAYPEGPYVLGQAPTGAGIRTYPYSFDMSIDPHTFADYGTGGGQDVEVHYTGEIWCSALWDMNWLLIDKYGFDPDLRTGYKSGGGPASAGNKLALQLVMDALKLQPANPSFTDARDAILLADRNLTGGVNQREIWTAFARRGLGFGADTTDSNSLTVAPAADMPPAAANNPGIIAASPVGLTRTYPAGVTLTFSQAMDTNSFSLADVLSVTGPNGVSLAPSSLIVADNPQTTAVNESFTWVDNKTLKINLVPQTAEGHYSITLAPTILSAATDTPLDQNINDIPGEAADRFTVGFDYDAAALNVVSITPINTGSVVNLGNDTLDVLFSRPVDRNSVGTDDLQLSQGTVLSATRDASNPALVHYVVSAPTEGSLYATFKYGAVTDLAGFPSQKKDATLSVDASVGTLKSPFPTPLSNLGTLGWQVYQGSVDAAISPNTDVDLYTISVRPGDKITVTLQQPAATLKLAATVVDGNQAVVATGTATAAGKALDLAPFTNTGNATATYTIRVTGAAGSGAYQLRVLLNSDVEAEALGGQTNNTPANAQSLNSLFRTQAGGEALASVRGTSDQGVPALAAEVEPNNTQATANVAANNFTASPAVGLNSNIYELSISGAASDSDLDYFNIGQLQNGDVLTIALSGVPSGAGTMQDAFLELLGATAGFITFDDDSGPGFDSLVYKFKITTTDTYSILAWPFDFNSGTYQLSVFLQNFGPAPNTGSGSFTEIEPNDTQQSANNVSGLWRKANYVSTTTGRITSGDTDFFQYQFTAGDVVSFQVQGAAGLTPQTKLFDANGNVLYTEDGTSTSAPLSGLFSYRIPATGAYTLAVGSKGGVGTYTVTVNLGSSTPPPVAVPATPDYYSFTLNTNDSVTLALDQIAGGAATVDLIAPDGTTVLQTGAAGATNFGAETPRFKAAAAGTYYARVTEPTLLSTDYVLSVLKNGTFDPEPNNTPDTATPASLNEGVIGALLPTDSDFYKFDVTNDGTVLLISVTAPGSGAAGAFANTLTPQIELYDPNNVLVASGAVGTPIRYSVGVVPNDPATGNKVATYKVRVVGTDANTTGEYEVKIGTTPNSPPVNVSAGGPYTIAEGQTLVLAGSATDPDGDPLSYSWDVNGDGTIDITGRTPNLSWSQLNQLGITDGVAPDGTTTRQVTVRVTDNFTGAVVSAPVTLTVNNAPPTATVSNDGPINEGSATRTANVIIDNITDPSPVDFAQGITYSISLDGGQTWVVGDGTYAGGMAYDATIPPGSTAPPPVVRSVTFPSAADGPVTQVVTVRVIDKDGGVQDYTTNVVVQNVPPTATFDLAPSGSVKAGTTASFVFSGQHDPSDADTAAGFTYSYDFNGNGSFTDPGDVNNSPLPLASFTFTDAGTYTVNGRITDKDGGSTTYPVTVTVTDVKPTATPSTPAPVPEGSTTPVTVSLTNPFHPSPTVTAAGFRYSFDIGGDGTWEVGSGTFAGSVVTNSVTVPASYFADGPATVKVIARVVDVNGLSSDYPINIDVTSVAPSATLNGPTGSNLLAGKPLAFSVTNPSDPSAADTKAGFHYAYDFDNDGKYEVGDGSYAGSPANAATTFSFTGAGTHPVRARIIDKDNAFTDLTTSVTLKPEVKTFYAVGADSGNAPMVRLFDGSGAERLDVPAFEDGFGAGVRVAVGDVNGDGTPDVVAGTGPGVPDLIRVLSGVDGSELFRAQPFEPSFTGGVFVAVGDVNGDGKADIAVTPDIGGGPRVVVYDGATKAATLSFMGIADPNFRGGARATIADMNGDGKADLIVAAGMGGGPRVAAFDGATLFTTRRKLFNDIFVFESTVRDGVFLAAGDINGDGIADLVVGGGPGGGPRVLALSGADLLAGKAGNSKVLANFFAGDINSRDGVRLAVADQDGDGKADIITSGGTNSGPTVRGFYSSSIGPSGEPQREFDFDAFFNLTTGVYVG